MVAETKAYRLLSQNKDFNQLLDNMRGKEYGLDFKQGIFTYDIPEKPTNLLRQELAPFMRIYPTYQGPFEHSDDKVLAMETRITINFWCETASQSEKIAKMMDEILETGGFERYTASELPRYKDNDIDLLINVRKYRFFDWDDSEEMKGK